MMYLKRVEVSQQPRPEIQGYYIIETESVVPGLRNRKLEAWFNGSTFDVANQTIVAWYKPNCTDRSAVNTWEKENKAKIKRVVRDPNYSKGIEKVIYTLVDDTQLILNLPL